jgi:hypothetical protein
LLGIIRHTAMTAGFRDSDWQLPIKSKVDRAISTGRQAHRG